LLVEIVSSLVGLVIVVNLLKFQVINQFICLVAESVIYLSTYQLSLHLLNGLVVNQVVGMQCVEINCWKDVLKSFTTSIIDHSIQLC